MRIPLDYYRILSVPVKATTAQLEQAYNDRLLQQPRREYSDLAIAARQQLIQYSYQLLSDPEQRADYDAQFLLTMQPLEVLQPEELEELEEVEELEDEATDTAVETIMESSTASALLGNPTIEIAPTQVVGGLLVLHELGEYESVLSIGIDAFNEREAALESIPEDESLDATQEDLILSLTLAYMELGREQWHRREYENAALSGQLGIDLLQQKSLFPHLQQELEQDLAKLRPYRVLELISQNPANSGARAEGFRLLQSMLLQRQGIEGKGEDRSGLNFDQFLCFVQQLRTYLTSAEQQQLFDNENQSKSAIANYLAVYALLGRGFALKQPKLVLRAQSKLNYLSTKQDVSWEQSIAALLLGHTERAIYKLKNSPDRSQLEQVQQHSLGSSDLLPGLCFYGEQWLLQDVLAQFGDLSATELTLKEYFADREVQIYLEQLSQPALTEVETEPVAAPPEPVENIAEEADSGIMNLWRNLFSGEKSTSVGSSNTARAASANRELVGMTAVREKRSSTATIERNQTGVFSARPKSHQAKQQSQGNHHQPDSRKSLSLPLHPKKARAVPASVMRKAKGQPNRSRKKRSSEVIWKGRLFVLGLIFGASAIGYLGTKLFLFPSNRVAKEAQLAIALDQPSVEIPTAKPKPIVAKPKPIVAKPTFSEQSQKVIQDWLSSKSAAFGKEHQIEQLNSILAEPLLTTWRERATVYQQEGIYREYEHAIVMRSAKVDPNDNNKATVEAEVKETAQHYQAGQLDQAQSYDDNLLLRYQLLRQGEKWLIHQAEVLETL